MPGMFSLNVTVVGFSLSFHILQFDVFLRFLQVMTVDKVLKVVMLLNMFFIMVLLHTLTVRFFVLVCSIFFLVFVISLDSKSGDDRESRSVMLVEIFRESFNCDKRFSYFILCRRKFGWGSYNLQYQEAMHILPEESIASGGRRDGTEKLDVRAIC